MTIQKKPNWRSELFAFVEASVREPFAAGKNDCALFAAGAVRAMTGHDPAKGWRGKYRTLKTGKKRLKEAGYSDLGEMAAAHFPEVPPLMAQVGDIATIEGDEDPVLGIVQGAFIWVRMIDGIGSRPLTDAKRVFRV